MLEVCILSGKQNCAGLSKKHFHASLIILLFQSLVICLIFFILLKKNLTNTSTGGGEGEGKACLISWIFFVVVVRVFFVCLGGFACLFVFLLFGLLSCVCVMFVCLFCFQRGGSRNSTDPVSCLSLW